MTIGERVKEKRIEKGMTQLELAKKLGYKSKTSVAHIENGRDIPRAMVSKLANILDTSPSSLMGWTDNNPVSGDVVQILPSENFRAFPLFDSASAGFGCYADSQITEYYGAYVESHFIAKQTVAIRVRGDSMYPKIEDGDVILVQKDGIVKSGDIGVAVIGEEAFVKKIVYDKESVSLISINPEYAPKLFKGEERDTVHVVGRVYRIIKEC